jgi:hypothetical protein
MAPGWSIVAVPSRTAEDINSAIVFRHLHRGRHAGGGSAYWRKCGGEIQLDLRAVLAAFRKQGYFTTFRAKSSISGISGTCT